ncbi:hydrogenase [Campylobacter sp. RM12327]|uniref:proton-conducting transporter transmembrane domain-containing protein n=1 Tax=Campylobacter sputorum TaxID=206 RepID=UPI000B7741ED|nr:MULTISPECIES: proton-conducting transporter membrane subunit [Campylobacter]ASM40681.1 hydrogenase-4, component B [Campylobacter sputorum]MBE7358588.1 hydrogenase [Campylobacter sp. RM11302]MBF6669941.1 hydrogenase [Campylobacter sp. RM12327]MBF6675103.1 hydrogenase [Campylobacter sp. RM13538]MBF6676697.1 hydrogenase [Campylobacter sp. RM12321]
MQNIYLLLFCISIVSILLYKKPLLSQKIGFCATSLVTLYGAIYFFINLNQVMSFELCGNFISNPKFRLEPLGNFFSFVICLISFAVSLYSIEYAKSYVKKANLAVFTSLYSAFVLSMLLVVASDGVFSFMLLWELMTLISAFLIMINEQKDSSRSVMIYLGISQIGAFCLMMALIIMGSLAGSFEFSKFGNLELSSFSCFGIFILLFIGCASKAGLWPFHVWLPLAHPAAPSNISALMSGIMIKVPLFAFIKFTLMLPISTYFAYILIFFGAIGAVFSVLYAVFSSYYKVVTAYSSSENIGIIFLGLGVAYYGISQNLPYVTLIGFIGVLFHILNHSVFKSLIFMLCGNIYHATHSKDMNDLGGLSKKMPVSATLFFIATLCVCAVPPFNGFASEWIIYKSFIASGANNGIGVRFFSMLGIVGLGVAGGLAIMAFSKTFGVIFLGYARNENIAQNAREVSKIMLFPLILLAIIAICLGVFMINVVKILLDVVDFSVNLSVENLSTKDFVLLPLFLVVLSIFCIIPFLLFVILKANNSPHRICKPWACGFIYNKSMQTNSDSFTGDLKKALRFLFKNKREIEIDGYFSRVKYTSKMYDLIWDNAYNPVIKFCVLVADKIGIFQNGRTNLYAVYILLYLCLMVVFVYHYL